MTPLLTADEAVPLLRVTSATVYDMARAGRIGCVRVGVGRGAVRFTEDHLREYLEREGRPPRCPSCNRRTWRGDLVRRAAS